MVAQAKREWAPFWDRKARAFLEKSIDHSTRITWLERHFGNVYFIAITRNGLAVSEGILRRSKPRGQAITEVGATYPKEMVAAQWNTFSERIHSDLETVCHRHHLRYEDLMEKPRKTIEAIFEFLDLPQPQIEETKIEGTGQIVSVNGRNFTFSNQNAASIARLSDEDRTALTADMAVELTRNGYLKDGVLL